MGYAIKLYMNKKTGQAVITLPAALRKLRGWQNHQELEWTQDTFGNLILRPKT